MSMWNQILPIDTDSTNLSYTWVLTNLNITSLPLFSKVCSWGVLPKPIWKKCDFWKNVMAPKSQFGTNPVQLHYLDVTSSNPAGKFRRRFWKGVCLSTSKSTLEWSLIYLHKKCKRKNVLINFFQRSLNVSWQFWGPPDWLVLEKQSNCSSLIF